MQRASKRRQVIDDKKIYSFISAACRTHAMSVQYLGKQFKIFSTMANGIQYINPDELSKNPAFSQVVTTQGGGRTIYVGGQNSVDANGEIVGKGDIAGQTGQVMKNLQAALSACGATFDNLVKLTIHIVQGQDLYRGFQASQKYLGGLKNPPAVTGFFVAALARPDYLVEIEAIAFVPEG